MPTIEPPTRPATAVRADWNSSMALIRWISWASGFHWDGLVTCDLQVTTGVRRDASAAYHRADATLDRPHLGAADTAGARARAGGGPLEPAGRRGAPRRPAAVQRAAGWRVRDRPEHPHRPPPSARARRCRARPPLLGAAAACRVLA